MNKAELEKEYKRLMNENSLLKRALKLIETHAVNENPSSTISSIKRIAAGTLTTVTKIQNFDIVKEPVKELPEIINFIEELYNDNSNPQ